LKKREFFATDTAVMYRLGAMQLSAQNAYKLQHGHAVRNRNFVSANWIHRQVFLVGAASTNLHPTVHQSLG